jgi:hypothetical protein
VASATLFAPPTFIRLINGLREYRAPAPIAAAKIRGALGATAGGPHAKTTTMSKPVRGVAFSFLCPHG